MSDYVITLLEPSNKQTPTNYSLGLPLNQVPVFIVETWSDLCLVLSFDANIQENLTSMISVNDATFPWNFLVINQPPSTPVLCIVNHYQEA